MAHTKMTGPYIKPVEGNLLTPYIPGSRRRVMILVSDDDFARVNGAGHAGRGTTVTDLVCGDEFTLRRAACGLGCRCAVEILP